MMSTSTFRKLVCQEVTADFEKAVKIITVQKQSPKEDEILVRTRYAGVNATDINITASRYSEGTSKVPFDVGLEGVGEVVEIGSGVKTVSVGQAVAYVSMNAYAEYVCIPVKMAIPIPSIKAEYVAMLISGLTASIGLNRYGEIKKGEIVLITAAAGGLGQFAVQWAKKAGCHVIGICSTQEKANFIKSLGCDFVINYKKENLDEVLKKNYPKGLDVIWETIGGKVFETLASHLRVKGRLVIIGAIEGYKSVGILPVDISRLPGQSSTIRGFLLTHFVEDFGTFFGLLAKLFHSGELKIVLDGGEESSDGPFLGLEGVTRAVQHLHSGKSTGKVVVAFP